MEIVATGRKVLKKALHKYGEDTGHLTGELQFSMLTLPLLSNTHHRSNGDCLEGKRENYQVCSVQYCVQQLCTVQCTHM